MISSRELRFPTLNVDPVFVFLYYPTPFSAVISSYTYNYPLMFMASTMEEAYQLGEPKLKAKPVRVELSSYSHSQYGHAKLSTNTNAFSILICVRLQCPRFACKCFSDY